MTWDIATHRDDISIVVSIVAFFVSFYALRSQKKYEADLAKTNYISKAKFDKEFDIYQELFGKIFVMVKASLNLFTHDNPDKPDNPDTKQRIKNANVAYNIVVETIYTYAPFIPKKSYDLLCNLKEKCFKQIEEYDVFLSRKEYDKDKVSYGQSEEIRKNLEKMDTEGRARNKEIEKKLDDTVSKIREYLASLDVYKQ